jgi:hypothetical protein
VTTLLRLAGTNRKTLSSYFSNNANLAELLPFAWDSASLRLRVSLEDRTRVAPSLGVSLTAFLLSEEHGMFLAGRREPYSGEWSVSSGTLMQEGKKLFRNREKNSGMGSERPDVPLACVTFHPISMFFDVPHENFQDLATIGHIYKSGRMHLASGYDQRTRLNRYEHILLSGFLTHCE